MIEIQDEGSQLAAALCRAAPGEKVLDLCAGGGGKTLALAARWTIAAKLFATDSDGRRLTPIFPRLERAGAKNVIVRAPRGKNDPVADLAGACDLVVVDAPCTGVGTWRRNPDAKWRMRPGALEQRQAAQDEVLAKGARFVGPGGRLVYVTCSLLCEENEDRIAAFLSKNPDFSCESAADSLRLAGLEGLGRRGLAPWAGPAADPGAPRCRRVLCRGAAERRETLVSSRPADGRRRIPGAPAARARAARLASRAQNSWRLHQFNRQAVEMRRRGAKIHRQKIQVLQTPAPVPPRRWRRLARFAGEKALHGEDAAHGDADDRGARLLALAQFQRMGETAAEQFAQVGPAGRTAAGAGALSVAKVEQALEIAVEPHLPLARIRASRTGEAPSRGRWRAGAATTARRGPEKPRNRGPGRRDRAPPPRRESARGRKTRRPVEARGRGASAPNRVLPARTARAVSGERQPAADAPIRRGRAQAFRHARASPARAARAARRLPRTAARYARRAGRAAAARFPAGGRWTCSGSVWS